MFRFVSLKIGSALILMMVFMALLAPWISPSSLKVFDLSLRLHAPSHQHWVGLLGFDEEGRDLLTLVFWGARVSLLVSLGTVLLAGTFGTLVGMFAGYFQGKWDLAFSFVTDVILAFPSILLVIALAAFQRESHLSTMILMLSAVGWVSYARLVRGQVLSLKNREYVSAARSLGAGTFRIWFRHLFPNLLPPLLVQATFSMAGVILAESTLSFLGLGISGDLPSWGRLLDQGVQYLLVAPHLTLFPALAIAILVLGFNFFGDGLRDYFDVRK